jgi:16S rRNA (guanine966-N2)-methyltransferase
MTRIIAGFAGSLALQVPRVGTRPTSDRVREAIFSALDSRDLVSGARVLDLFAGSGALGLEAISRGARSATLVELGSQAARICRANAAAVLRAGTSPLPAVDVKHSPVKTFLETDAGEYDLVFLDPPYELSDVEFERELALTVPRLSADAVVVVERSARSSELLWPPPLRLDRRKNYGDTTLWWLHAATLN